MALLDPTAAADEVERKALSPRLDGLSGTRIGLLGNGKQAAEPVLNIVERRLRERYGDDVEVDYYLVDELNLLKDDAELERITDWAAADIDVGITAIGDCGSCTKFLAWGTDAVEEAGVPAVGLLDQGFVLDWQSNAIEWGRPLRYEVIPVRCEVVDRDRIDRELTADVLDGIEDELTRPLTDEESLASAPADD